MFNLVIYNNLDFFIEWNIQVSQIHSHVKIIVDGWMTIVMKLLKLMVKLAMDIGTMQKHFLTYMK